MNKTDIKSLGRDELEAMVPYEPGKPVEELTREYGLEKPPVKLASNENPFSPPDELKDAYDDEFHQLNRYPDGGCFYLRQALSDHHSWPADGIVVGGGSDEVVDCLAKATLNSGDEVLTGDPAFVRYRMVAQMMGADPVEVPLTDSFDYDLQAIKEKVTDSTAWICLPNPNNPTSRYINETNLQSFLGDLPAHVIVILDEAYFELMNQSDYPDGTAWLTGEFETEANIVVLRTFSKAFGLAGLRVGYGLMDPALASEIHKVRPPFNVTRPGQAVARAALNHRDYLDQVTETLDHQRQILVSRLDKLGLDVVEPSANFMLVRTPGGDPERLTEQLMERGVIIRPMGPYGLDEHVRVSVGTPSENDRFLEELDDILG